MMSSRLLSSQFANSALVPDFFPERENLAHCRTFVTRSLDRFCKARLLIERKVAACRIFQPFGQQGGGVIDILNVCTHLDAELPARLQAAAAIDRFEAPVGSLGAPNEDWDLLTAFADAILERLETLIVILGVYSCKFIQSILRPPIINQTGINLTDRRQ